MTLPVTHVAALCVCKGSISRLTTSEVEYDFQHNIAKSHHFIKSMDELLAPKKFIQIRMIILLQSLLTISCSVLVLTRKPQSPQTDYHSGPLVCPLCLRFPLFMFDSLHSWISH